MKQIVIRVKKRKLRAFKLIAVGLSLLAALLSLDSRIRPVVETISTYQAKLAATKSINDAVISVISEEDVVYNTIVTINQDREGGVASLETDMITMNRLKALITNRISRQLIDDSQKSVDVPLGTMFGGQLLSGRGPEIEFRVLPVGYVQTELYNEFTSAGINQTLHQVMLRVTATVSAVVPVYTVTTDVTTNICIAETVIVGKVPSAFTDINGDSRSALDKINDYQAIPNP